MHILAFGRRQTSRSTHTCSVRHSTPRQLRLVLADCRSVIEISGSIGCRTWFRVFGRGRDTIVGGFTAVSGVHLGDTPTQSVINHPLHSFPASILREPALGSLQSWPSHNARGCISPWRFRARMHWPESLASTGGLRTYLPRPPTSRPLAS